MRPREGPSLVRRLWSRRLCTAVEGALDSEALRASPRPAITDLTRRKPRRRERGGGWARPHLGAPR